MAMACKPKLAVQESLCSQKTFHLGDADKVMWSDRKMAAMERSERDDRVV